MNRMVNWKTTLSSLLLQSTAAMVISISCLLLFSLKSCWFFYVYVYIPVVTNKHLKLGFQVDIVIWKWKDNIWNYHWIKILIWLVLRCELWDKFKNRARGLRPLVKWDILHATYLQKSDLTKVKIKSLKIEEDKWNQTKFETYANLHIHNFLDTYMYYIYVLCLCINKTILPKAYEYILHNNQLGHSLQLSGVSHCWVASFLFSPLYWKCQFCGGTLNSWKRTWATKSQRVIWVELHSPSHSPYRVVSGTFIVLVIHKYWKHDKGV